MGCWFWAMCLKKQVATPLSQAPLIHHEIKNLSDHEHEIKCCKLLRFCGCFYTIITAAKANKATVFIVKNYCKLVIVASDEEYKFEFLKQPNTIKIIGLKTKYNENI